MSEGTVPPAVSIRWFPAVLSSILTGILRIDVNMDLETQYPRGRTREEARRDWMVFQVVVPQ